MRRLLLLLLLLVCGVHATVNTWVGGVNSSAKNAANWTGGVLPGATDTILYSSAGNTNCTFDSAFSVGAVILRNSYTATFNDGGYSMTVAGVCSVGTAGTFSASGLWTQTTDKNFALTNTGTYNISAMQVVLNGTGTFTIGKSSTTIAALTCAASNKTTTIAGMGAGAGISSGLSNLLTCGSGSLTVSATYFNLYTSASCSPYSLTNTTIDGSSSAINVLAVGTGKYTITLPALGVGGTMSIYVAPQAGSNDTITFSQTGGISTVNGPIVISVFGGTGSGHRYKTNDNAITCGGATGLFYFGSYLANKTIIYDFGNSNIVCQGINNTGSYNAAACSLYLATSSWTIKGDITLGSNTSISPGSSLWTITTNECALTSLSKPLYDLTFNNATKKDTLKDSLFVHNFTCVAGKIKGLSNGGTCTGNMTLGGTDSVFARMASGKWWTFPNASTFQQTTTGARLFDSMRIEYKNNFQLLPDSTLAIKRLKNSSGDTEVKLTLKAARVCTLQANVAGDLSGTEGHIDTIVSSSAGNLAGLYFGIQPAPSYLYVKDFASYNYSLTCTTGCVNGGNDSNVVFDVPVISSVKQGKCMAGKPDTLLGNHFRTSGGTATLGGTAVTITKQVADSIIFTVPAKARGTYDLVYAHPGGRDTVSYRVLVPQVLSPNGGE